MLIEMETVQDCSVKGWVSYGFCRGVVYGYG